MSEIRVYQSITKFVEFMKEHLDDQTKNVTAYFDGDDVFKNQFNNICVKPIFIKATYDSENKYLSHKKIIEIFGGELVLSFNENNKRKLTKAKNLLYELKIDFQTKEFNGNKYYSSTISTCLNKRNIDMIRKQINTQQSVEESIPFDAFV